MAAGIDKDLLEAYLDTDYIVEDDPPLLMRIDEQNDGLRVLLASFNVESAAFITAWNPGGRELPLEENWSRQADLLHEIETLRLNYFVGRGERQDWLEDSYLILGISREQATALAYQFGQNAFVWISMGGVPELVVV